MAEQIKRAVEYKGEEFLYAVGEGELMRAFNQTDGSHDISADEIELDTKDKTGSDYGKVTESHSLEGILTKDDPFVDYVTKAIRNKEMITMHVINTRTLKAEKGMYMISSFNRGYTNGDFATYSLDVTLNGDVEEVELSAIPDGAPANEGEEEKEPVTPPGETETE